MSAAPYEKKRRPAFHNFHLFLRIILDCLGIFANRRKIAISLHERRMRFLQMRTVKVRDYSLALFLVLTGLDWTARAGDAATALPQAPPQGPLKQLSLEQLGNLEVTTASKSPEQVWKTAAAIFVITQEDIKRSGATSIPEALRLAPGVEVARVDGNTWSIGIRGFGSNLTRDVLVLIDGRSVYSTLLAGTYWDVQDTVIEDIDRIEVIRGPGGTVWGPNAVNGVIDIITKKSQDTQGTLVTLGGGDEEQGFLSARYGGGNSKGLTYRVYGKGFNRGPEFHPNGQDYDRWRSIQGGFRTDWNKNARDTFTLQGDIYDEGAGESANLVSYTPPYSQQLDQTAPLSGGNLLGRWTRVFSEGQDIQLQAYYDRTNRHSPNFGDLRNTFDVDYLQRFRIGDRNQFSFGLGARASQGHEIEIASGLFFSPGTRTDQLYSAFVQDNIALVPNRVTLEIGTKLLHTNYTGVQAEPSARFMWTPTETETIWAAFTRAVRTPSDGERDFFLSGYIGPDPATGLQRFARFNGNPNFKSEVLNGYELGFRHLLGKSFYVDLAGFFNQYHDLFSEDLTGGFGMETTPPPSEIPPSTHLLLPAEFGNGLMGTTTGGEFAPEWKPTSFWALKGSYSFLHMVLKKEPGSQDVGTGPIIAGSSPQHQVLAQSQFDLPRHFTLDLSYRYVSALPAQTVRAYSTGSVRLGWNPTRHLELSVVGSNLLQPYHFEYPSTAINRSFYGKLEWRSKEN